ncbi:FAD synthase-like [Rhynchophorus ferrugineus]|uniref:FAD synthase-like n=1 Tax=Rhynchophorus ferrugineus TaxID=354439 RepID=UPI003FCCB4F1
MNFKRFNKINRLYLKVRSLCTEKNSKITTAGVLVIGDEILKGEIPDTNSHFLAKELHNLGLNLKKISVVSDDVNDISEEVKHFSSKYNYVITTGGIGPTHDDVTYEAVALAFNEPLVLNSELKDICCRYFKTKDPKAAGMKQAYIPKSSILHYTTISGGKLPYPSVSTHNVFMFPGIPELVKLIMTEAGPLLFHSDKRFFTKCIYCNLPEYKIIEQLEQLVLEFPDVSFGCYPKFYHSLYQVKLTIESLSKESTTNAYLKLLELIPSGCIVQKDDL